MRANPIASPTRTDSSRRRPIDRARRFERVRPSTRVARDGEKYFLSSSRSRLSIPGLASRTHERVDASSDDRAPRVVVRSERDACGVRAMRDGRRRRGRCGTRCIATNASTMGRWTRSGIDRARIVDDLGTTTRETTRMRLRRRRRVERRRSRERGRRRRRGGARERRGGGARARASIDDGANVRDETGGGNADRRRRRGGRCRRLTERLRSSRRR